MKDASRARWMDAAAKRIAPFALIWVLGLAVWGKAFGFEFVWDDEYFIVKNTAIRDISCLPRYFVDVDTMAAKDHARDFTVFRPLRNISYLVDFGISGLDPRWWHVHNVILHLVNASLAFLIARRLFGGSLPSLFVAGLFLLHPVQTEAVAWVKCRDDLLCAFFALGSFVLWLRWRDMELKPGRTAVLCALYVMAMLSKIQGLILPLLWFGYDFWTGASVRRGGRRGLAGASCAAALCVVLWRHLFLGRTGQCGYLAGGFLPTMLTMTRAGAEYLRLAIFPFRQSADYTGMEASYSLWDGRVLVSLGILAVAGLGALAARRRYPVGSFGLAWAAALFLPVWNIVPTMQYMAERFMYLPMLGFALAGGAAAGALWRFRSGATRLAAASVVVALGLKTFARLDVWRNNRTLFEATVRDAPGRPLRIRENLLYALMASGDYASALAPAQELFDGTATSDMSAEGAARKKAEYARHLGFILYQLGREDVGMELLRKAIAADGGYAQAHVDIGVIEGRRGNHSNALESFTAAALIAPDFSAAHHNRGIALLELGDIGGAEREFRLAIEAGATDAGPHRSLAAMLVKQGRDSEASAVYRAALRAWPGDQECRYWLGRVDGGLTHAR